MSYFIKQSSATRPLLFLMVLSSDHISPATGLTPTVTISKSGGSFATPSGAVSEIANGWYQVAANTTDSNTLGPMILHATASGADPTDTIFRVVAFDPDSATNLGLSNLDTNVGSRSTYAGGAADADAATILSQVNKIGTNSADSPNTITAQNQLTNLSIYTIRTGTAQAGTNISITLDSGASSINSTYNGCFGKIIGGTGQGSTFYITSYVGSTKVATISNIFPVAPDSSSQFIILQAQPMSVAYWVGTLVAATLPASGTLSTYSGGAVASVTAPVQVDMTQAVPTSNTAQTHGDALNAARAQGFGKWVISGTSLTLFAGDGTTVVRTFTLDSSTAPTQRS